MDINCLERVEHYFWRKTQCGQWAVSKREHESVVSCSVTSDSLWSIDCSPPGSSVHGSFQTGILQWVAPPFSRGSPWPRAGTRVSCIAGRLFSIWAIGKSLNFAGKVFAAGRLLFYQFEYIILLFPGLQDFCWETYFCWGLGIGMWFFLYVMSFFSLADLIFSGKMLSLSLILTVLLQCFNEVLVGLNLIEDLWPLCTRTSIFFPRFGVFGAIISLNKLSAPLFPF